MRLTAFVVLLVPQAFAGDADISSKITALAQSYVEWGSGASSPGASLPYKEVSRPGARRTYHVLVTGLPKNGTYALLQWPVTMDKPAVLRNPVFIDATGVLLCKKGGDVNSSDDTVNLIVDSVPGEPVRNAVVSLQDRTIHALGKMTQRPMEGVDKTCHLGVTYLTAHGEVVFVEASGLAPGEAFTLSMHSGSKDVKQDATASATGDYRISFLPFDPKSTSKKGRAELRIQAPSCTPALTFPWGDFTAE